MGLLPEYGFERFLKYCMPIEKKYIIAEAPSLLLSTGDVLVRRGDGNETLYLIEDGELEVVDIHEGQEVVVTTLHAGDLIGEMAFLTGMPCSATIRALQTTTVRMITRDFLTILGREAPELLGKLSLAICEIIAERMRRNIEELNRLTQTIRAMHERLQECTDTMPFAADDDEDLFATVQRQLRCLS